VLATSRTVATFLASPSKQHKPRQSTNTLFQHLVPFHSLCLLLLVALDQGSSITNLGGLFNLFRLWAASSSIFKHCIAPSTPTNLPLPTDDTHFGISPLV